MDYKEIKKQGWEKVVEEVIVGIVLFIDEHYVDSDLTEKVGRLLEDVRGKILNLALPFAFGIIPVSASIGLNSSNFLLSNLSSYIFK